MRPTRTLAARPGPGRKRASGRARCRDWLRTLPGILVVAGVMGWPCQSAGGTDAASPRPGAPASAPAPRPAAATVSLLSAAAPAPVSPDGAGTMTVSPGLVQAGQVTTLTFAYTAAAGQELKDGTVTLDVPPGWTPPSLVPGPGFISISCSGCHPAVSDGAITISSLDLDPLHGFIISYSTATAPGAAGDDIFPAGEMSIPGGSPAPLLSSPLVTVQPSSSASASPSPTVTATSSPPVTASASPSVTGTGGPGRRHATAGAGSITVSPDRVTASRPGTLTFTYRAGARGLRASGVITLVVARGWTRPSRTPGTAGYTTARPGVLSVSGRRITVTGATLGPAKALTITYRAARAPGTAGIFVFRAFRARTAGQAGRPGHVPVGARRRCRAAIAVSRTHPARARRAGRRLRCRPADRPVPAQRPSAAGAAERAGDSAYRPADAGHRARHRSIAEPDDPDRAARQPGHPHNRGGADMTPAGPAHPRTAMELIFGPGEGATGALAERILSAGADQNLGRALANLPKVTRDAAVREVTAEAAGLLDVNLADVLVAGWREHHDLTSAARRTLAVPGSTELVALAAHRVTIEQQPYITVLVDGHQVATVRLGLSLAFEVTALLAGISAGRLAAVHTGHCDVTAALAIQGAELVTREARFELPGVIPLGTGIRLLAAGEYAAGRDSRSQPTAR